MEIGLLAIVGIVISFLIKIARKNESIAAKDAAIELDPKRAKPAEDKAYKIISQERVIATLVATIILILFLVWLK